MANLPAIGRRSRRFPGISLHASARRLINWSLHEIFTCWAGDRTWEIRPGVGRSFQWSRESFRRRRSRRRRLVSGTGDRHGGNGRGRGRQRRRLHLEALEPRLVLDASMLRITEFVASNDDGIADADGDNSDWLEIYNSGDDAVDLVGHAPHRQRRQSHQVDDSQRRDARRPAATWSSSPRTRTACWPAASCTRISPSPPAASTWRSSTPTAPRSSTHTRPISRRRSKTSPTAGRCRTSGAPTTLLADGAAAKAHPCPPAARSAPPGATSASTTRPGRSPARRASATRTIPATRSTTRARSPRRCPAARATAYIRVKFNLASLDDIDRLTLRMKYDDGFAAYINGVPVAEANAPETLQWNSRRGGHARRRAVEHVPGLRHQRGDSARCASARTCWRSTR